MASASKYIYRALAVLKTFGITVALDDFGTGHSSLSHLRDFPVDVVKIDRSIVRQMAGGEENAAHIRAVINLGASLKIQSVAEGVETRDRSTYCEPRVAPWGRASCSGARHRPISSVPRGRPRGGLKQ